MIFNAQIVNTNITEEGISIEFGFEIDGKSGSAYLPMSLSVESIKTFMALVGVKVWEMLRGQYVRIESGEDYKMTRIGNIVHDQWIDLGDNTQAATEETVEAEIVSE